MRRSNVVTSDVVAECLASRKLQYNLVTSIARKRQRKREEAAALIIQKHARARWLLLRPDASAKAKSTVVIAKIVRDRRQARASAARISASIPFEPEVFPSSTC